MGQNEAKVRQRPEDAPAASDGSFSSLSKTLEDLEQRLSRLSSTKTAAAAPAEEPAEATATRSAGEKLRVAAEARRARRPSLTAAVSNVAVESVLASEADEPHRRAAAGRRIGTIAAEVEQLQMQNASIALIKDLAAELTLLRGDIQSRIGTDTDERIRDLQTSFAELKRMISERDAPESIGAEIFEIMEQLTELTAGTADQASLEALRGDLDAVALMVGQMAREESLEAVKRRWDAFETRISEHMSLDAEAKRNLKVELERLRTSLRSLATEDQVLAVQQRWEEFEARYLDTARVQAEESVANVLRTELDGLREKLDAIVAENGQEAMDARFEALAERLDIGELEAGVSRLGERMREIEHALMRMPEILQIDQLEMRVAALAQSIEILTQEVREPDLSHFALLEERLDEIAAALASQPAPAVAQIDMAPVERIEARVADLTGRIDKLADQRGVEALSSQIAALAERVEDIGAAAPTSDLGERIDTLAERVETLFRRTGGADTAAFEERLTAIAQRLEDSASARVVDPEVIVALETQITRMTQILAGVPGASVEDAGAVSQRLDAIERQLDENRDNVVAAARAAAEEAVRRMRVEDARRETGFVQELAQDMRNLEALCRESDERTFGVFDAVHATLLKIVERLTLIEQEMRGQPVERAAAPMLRPATIETAPIAEAPVSVTPPAAEIVAASDAPVFAERAAAADAAADEEPKGLRAALQRHIGRRTARTKADASAVPSLAERIRPTPIVEESTSVDAPSSEADEPKAAVLEAPELDPADSLISREANRPLEPGSGAPDIAALIERVRQQQRGEEPAPEPMAKADFIAAARKAAMAAAAEAEALREREERGEDLAGKPAANRRKPILMGVGAVLLALMAVPFGIDRLSPKQEAAVGLGETATVAAAPAPVAVPETSAVSSEPVDVAALARQPMPAEMPSMTETGPAVAEAPAAPAIPQGFAETAPARPDMVDVPSQTSVAEPSPAPLVETAVASPAAVEPGALLASVRQQLPEAARGAMPALPQGIASEALAKAVSAEDPKALFEIGLRVMEGRNAPSDPAAALAWFAQSATRGFAPAQYSLGTLYEKGNGVERNAATARDWYLLAAEQGNVRAMHNLAVLYATGIDGKSEPANAAKWFIQAADHGMRDSQYNLGILFARGAGVEQDLAKSYRWFGIVASAGDKDAAAKMQEVGKTMSPEQRQALDTEIASWSAQPRVETANTVEIPDDWSETAGRTASVDMSRAIRNVQAILIKLGYDPGQPDGKVGARTEAAIRQFQGKAGLEATGKVDEPLIRALLERKDA
ncbi:peptidoglycan-binding protein [Aureimonas phyllosphaerae]|uniref:Localization factor PodJL n=1 Tax=Aureimonas phyllosphaerae TaxID=1166078 RepID=A0A7W6FTV8_9HYPH|nr:peptidoglycan-binding protein [Aureimonas phyllosphaerae]MBB3934382.1 localization factor PodJL [Aureimonas phyllosphaerae]MBB3958402.1 localization factor PodJL [Aureimonas phyllosphaerae]SFE96430.1 localization factor PodJL [Aureimonas phyllosphaerae]